MKEYTIYKAKKARFAQGACVACGKLIGKGDAYKYAEDQSKSKYVKVLFCANCEVQQSLIGKNRENGKVRKALDLKTSGQAKQIASFITEEKKPKVTKPAPAEEDDEEENGILANSCLEIPKVYCSKCKRNHEVGSRRYERHIHYIKKS